MGGSKLASGGWLLLFFQLQLSLWTRILLFWVSQTYYLVCLLAPFYDPGTILSAWGHPRGPWERQEGHVGVRNKILIDFGLIFRPHFESFLGFDGLNSMFVLGLFPGDFLHRFSSGIIDSWSSQNKVFVRKVLQKPCFRKNRSLVIREPIFGVFWRPWGWFF